MGRLSDSIDSIWFVKLDTTKVCSTMTCDMCKYSTYVHDYSCIQWPPMLVGGLEHVLFSIIYRIILPLIFFKMVKNHQPVWYFGHYLFGGFKFLWVFRGLNHQGRPCPARWRCQDWGAVGSNRAGVNHGYLGWIMGLRLFCYYPLVN